MSDTMYKRGPDGGGFWFSNDRCVGLVHRRLAILDLSPKAAQPMHTSDNRFCISFNGEIYNYKSLREGLSSKGYSFHSDSDTEVLLYLYQEYGHKMVALLRGMFAFAIYDTHKRSLFLARDHFGIKPLYYRLDTRQFIFASQVKTLLSGNAFPLEPEPAGHVGFYLWGCVPEPYTLYKGVFSLPAGHTITIFADGNGGKPVKFFDVVDEITNCESNADSNPGSVLAAELKDSVAHHLLADVDVGVFLSSGRDSATLAALVSEISHKFCAVTLGFKEYEGTQNDEVPLAQKVARYYGATHYIDLISKSDFDQELPSILESMDQPSIDGVNTYFVARAAKRAGLKVALSGVGADELLGGYPSFSQIPKLVSLLSLTPKVAMADRLFRVLVSKYASDLVSPKYAGLLAYGGNFGGAYLLRRGLFMPWELAEFLDHDFIDCGLKKLDPVNLLNSYTKPLKSGYSQVAAAEISLYMRNMLLRDSDWAGMAHSIEIRTPFVDVKLFKSILPYLNEPKRRIGKKHLASIPVKALPVEILRRPKTGFSIPIREWTGQHLRSTDPHRRIRNWGLFVNKPQCLIEGLRAHSQASL